MGTITFDPRATDSEFRACNHFFGVVVHTDMGVEGERRHAETSCWYIPCDLTLDPRKPETWARAVYEAGNRDRVREEAYGIPCNIPWSMFSASPPGPSPERVTAADVRESMKRADASLGVPADPPLLTGTGLCRWCGSDLSKVPMTLAVHCDGFVFCGEKCAMENRRCPAMRHPIQTEPTVSSRPYDYRTARPNIIVDGVQYTPVNP